MTRSLHYLLNNNDLESALTALVLALVCLVAMLSTRRILTRRLRKYCTRTATIWDDVLADVIESTRYPFILGMALLAGLTQIDLPQAFSKWPHALMLFLLILQTGFWANRALASWVGLRVSESLASDDGASATNYNVIAFVARLAVWLVVILSVLDNLGVNITTLVASLGIGGVAVALALQNVLSDIFASLSIALDKPFVVGDFIVIDSLMGTVRHVGLKTTRIQSLSGEELVFSNNDLLKSRIRNYKHMAERRALFTFGVTYDTPPATLKALATEVERIISTQPDTRFDRAHFKTFGASSLDFEVVYYMLVPDFNAWMNTQQDINLALLDYCNTHNIGFAFPTQTIHLAHSAAQL